LPRFANSAMDGFAVVSRATPGRFEIVERLLAGDEAGAHRVDAQHAIEIMTGAPTPPGADAVVRVEDVRVEAGATRVLTVPSAVLPMANIRPAGEDYRAGGIVVRSGSVLTPEHLLAIAQTGSALVRVRVRPRVAIIPTGRELEIPGTALPTLASIWASSSVYLATALEAAGCVPLLLPIVRDDVDTFLAAFDQVTDAHLVLSTGAVSAGVQDFIPAALRSRGAKQHFHKVAVRPAKPVLFCEHGGRLVFGLPGNPISSAVAYRFLVWPAIARLLGLPVERPVRATLRAAQNKPEGMRCFYKAHLVDGVVDIDRAQGSHLVRPLAECNAWAVLEEGGVRLEAGTSLDVYPLQPRASF
jgi:molybdopterin molybdotransferase